MSPLQSFERKFLRSQAHHLEPVVMIGKQGLTEAVVAKTVEALAAHELIKVRFIEFKEEKKTLAPQLAEAAGAELAGIVGHVAILYKAPEPGKERKLHLPQRS